MGWTSAEQERRVGGLGEAKSTLLRGLFASLSDHALKSLDAALEGGVGCGGPLLDAYVLSQEALRDREARSVLLAPLLPLSARSHPLLPPCAPAALWRALRLAEPAATDLAARAAHDGDDPKRAMGLADDLLERAADGLATGDRAAWRDLATTLDHAQPGASAKLLDILHLVPVLRRALPRLGVWVRTMAPEHGAALRLAFRDASEMEPPKGPLLVDVLAAHLQHPWQVLRLISAVMDRPNDAYLAASELAGFGEAVLADVDARILQVKTFDLAGGAEAGSAAAASVHTAAMQAVEFEKWVQVNRGGAWGKRLVGQRRDLARAVEQRLKECESVVARALPVDAPRGRTRGAPKLDLPLDPKAAAGVEALTAFLDGVRTSAAFGGFAVMRAKVMEALDARLDHYAEDILEMIHADPSQAEALRDRLDLAADALGRVRDPEAASLVRRRAAAA